jgi:hypothetical protein
MLPEPIFFRLGEGWLNPRKICHAERARDDALIIYMDHGRLVARGSDADRLSKWIDAQAVCIPSQAPVPIKVLAGGRSGHE